MCKCTKRISSFPFFFFYFTFPKSIYMYVFTENDSNRTHYIYTLVHTRTSLNRILKSYWTYLRQNTLDYGTIPHIIYYRKMNRKWRKINKKKKIIPNKHCCLILFTVSIVKGMSLFVSDSTLTNIDEGILTCFFLF